MTEKQTIKQMIKLCEAMEKETPEIKNGYYTRIKKKLVKRIAFERPTLESIKNLTDK